MVLFTSPLDVYNWLMSHGGDIVSVLTGAVTVASLISNLFPNRPGYEQLGKVQALINALALNIFHIQKHGVSDIISPTPAASSSDHEPK